MYNFKLANFLLRHTLIGFALSATTVAAMIYWNFNQMGTLILGSSSPILIIAVLTFFMGLTLASAQMGMAVMLLAEPEDKGSRGKFIGLVLSWLSPPRQMQPIPIPVKSKHHPHRGRHKPSSW
ncbi:hypothetical protein [Magnetococcus sp. PR-3]|uniref:hypothetical protein n=1 Tax=Magnetococcus sp. PR-3 TaxID=3120355 RepID=UPI002FCDE7E4